MKTKVNTLTALLKLFGELEYKGKTITLKDSIKKKDNFVNANSAKMERAFQKFWEEQGQAISNKDVQESLNTLTLSDSIVSDVTAATALFGAMGFKPSFSSVLGTAGEVQASAISSATGKPFVFDMASQKVVDFINNNALNLTEDFTMAEMATLRNTLSDAIASGWSNVKTANAMRNNIGLTPKQLDNVINYRKRLEKAGDLKPSEINKLVSQRINKSTITRAKTIARTETARAYNGSRDQAAQQAIDSGLVSGGWKIWRTAGDDRVRPEHEAMEGERVRVGETFSNGSEYPDDINERCIVEYVLEA
jgi:SPP1 gp7 family putative phage head morphogenesis protein